MSAQAPPFRVAYVGLGSNLADPQRQVQEAFDELARIPHTSLLRRSSCYRTVPVGKADQPDFVNAVAMVETTLPPDELLQHLLAIEARHGRVRAERNGPRTLDLDLLLFGDRVVHAPGLEVPHPRMHERGFVLLPLTEVDPDAFIPGHGRVADLLKHVTDQGVTRIDGTA